MADEPSTTDEAWREAGVLEAVVDVVVAGRRNGKTAGHTRIQRLIVGGSKLHLVDPKDPYDDKRPWGEPDYHQCDFNDGKGHQCVLGRGHTVDHLPKTCKGVS